MTAVTKRKITAVAVATALSTQAAIGQDVSTTRPIPKTGTSAATVDLSYKHASPSSQVGMLRPDAERLEFSSLEALRASVLEVMKAFLSPDQLVDLEKGLMLSGPSKHPTSGAEILKSYSEERKKPAFDELKFRQKLLTEIGESYGLKLTPVDITPVAVASGLRPTYLLAALPLVALGRAGGGGSSATAADFVTTEYQAQYGLGSINASTAYARGFTGAGVTVSVLDSPFDTGHPDLAGKFVTGYNANTAGTDVTCTPSSCTSTHGTFVSGIIAASKNDSGMHGVAYGASIKPVTVFDSSGTWNVTSAQLALAVAAGSGSGIAVMNNSWGTREFVTNGSVWFYRPAHTTFAAAVTSAFETAVSNTVVVFANGNSGWNSATGRIPLYNSSGTYLGTYATTTSNRASGEGRQPIVNGNLAGAWLTVVALDSNNVIASYSNGCGDAKAFCISAPGSNIYSTVDRNYSGSGYSPSGGFGTADGTSFAAPHVAGALAILKQQFPNLTPSQLVSLLISTATDLGAAGVDEVYGVGMLNLASATTPQGVLRIASGGASASDLYTTQNTGLRVSRVMGSSLAGLKVGILDGYNRSYEWAPTLSKTAAIDFKPVSYFPKTVGSQDTLLATSNIKLTGELTKTNSGSELTGTNLSWSSDYSKVSLRYSNLQQQLPTWLPDASIGPGELFAFQVTPGITGLTSVSGEHQLGRDIKLFVATTAARYEGSGAFRETSYGVNFSAPKYQITLRAGLLTEQEQFLGTTGYGAYSMANPAETSFWSLGGSVKLSDQTLFSGHYSAAKTKVRFKYSELISASDIVTDEFQLILSKTGLFTENGVLSINLQAPLSIKAGQFNQSTTVGYTEGGAYRAMTQTYDLASDNRERIVSLVFRQPGKLFNSFAGLYSRWNSNGVAGIRDTGVRLGFASSF